MKTKWEVKRNNDIIHNAVSFSKEIPAVLYYANLLSMFPENHKEITLKEVNEQGE